MYKAIAAPGTVTAPAASPFVPTLRRRRLLAAVRGQLDARLLSLTLLLLGFGLVMLYSSSADVALERTGDHMYYLKRQSLWVLIGITGLALFAHLDYRRLRALAPYILLAAVGLLVLTEITSRQAGVAGAARWLKIGPFSGQPSDLARLAMIIFLAAYIERKGPGLKNFWRGLLPPACILAVIMVLILRQPDFSTAVLIGLLGIALLFIGGARVNHLAALALVAVPALAAALISAPYRLERVKTFLGLSDSPEAGYQVSQALIGLGNGGWLGQGLGNSIEKKFFLPTPHTDFVFAIIGEELGFLGAVGLLIAFILVFQRGILIAKNAPDRFGLFLALGITVQLILYVLINAAVVAELLPNTGIPLPFISYGGTHLVSTLVGLGILLNVSSASRRLPAAGRYSRPRRNKVVSYA